MIKLTSGSASTSVPFSWLLVSSTMAMMLIERFTRIM